MAECLILPPQCTLHSRNQSCPPRFALLCKPYSLIHCTQQLRLQYELPLLVLLTRLKCFVILPPHRLLTLPARYIPYDMPPGGHISFRGFRLRDVYNGVEEIGFAVLAAKVLRGIVSDAVVWEGLW